MAAISLTVTRENGMTIVTAPGIQGPPGIQGSVGSAGPTGPAGPQGNSFLMMGTLPAGAWDAPDDPTIGDTWIAGGTITGEVTAVIGDGIEWTGTEWLNVGQIRGPIGPTGATGPAGPAQIVAGFGDPNGVVEMTGPGIYLDKTESPPIQYWKVTPGTSSTDWI